MNFINDFFKLLNDYNLESMTWAALKLLPFYCLGFLLSLLLLYYHEPR